MKKLFTLMAMFGCSLCMHAQQTVNFKINHMLGNNTLMLNQTAVNNTGDDFQVTRLQYYISDIVLYHDDTSTAVANLHILVNASQSTDIQLGNFNIQQLDSVSFGIGVGPNENHLDPNTYTSTHPLAPQSPSMHWGWTSGYRFIALEGVTGTNMSDVFQMHSLGDDNYHITTIVTNGIVDGTDLDVVLNADYIEALNTLDLTGGIISHGDKGEAQVVIENFNNFVFTAASSNVSVQQLAHNSIRLFPNPVQVGQAVFLQDIRPFEHFVEVFNIYGQCVKTLIPQTQQCSVQLDKAGVYLIKISNHNKQVYTYKVQVYE